MEIVDFIPTCGSMSYTRRGTYHKLKRSKEVSDCNTSKNVTMFGPKKLKMVEMMMPKVQPKIIRLSTSLCKRIRDAYVHGMLCMAMHVAHLNNGETCFLKKIHDGDDDDDVLYLKAS